MLHLSGIFALLSFMVTTIPPHLVFLIAPYHPLAFIENPHYLQFLSYDTLSARKKIQVADASEKNVT